MINDLVKENERVDDLQNGYYIIQDPQKFCFGMDAVLLSGFARVKKGEKVLDMGTGTGIIPVLLASKTPGEHFSAVGPNMINFWKNVSIAGAFLLLAITGPGAISLDRR